MPVACHRALASTRGGGMWQDLDFNRIALTASWRINTWFSGRDSIAHRALFLVVSIEERVVQHLVDRSQD